MGEYVAEGDGNDIPRQIASPYISRTYEYVPIYQACAGCLYNQIFSTGSYCQFPLIIAQYLRACSTRLLGYTPRLGSHLQVYVTISNIVVEVVTLVHPHAVLAVMLSLSCCFVKYRMQEFVCLKSNNVRERCLTHTLLPGFGGKKFYLLLCLVGDVGVTLFREGKVEEPIAKVMDRMALVTPGRRS